MPIEEQITRFVAFCIEEYKRRHGGSGASVYARFASTGILDFLTRHFAVEHCLDPEQILDDLDQIVARRSAEVAS